MVWLHLPWKGRCMIVGCICRGNGTSCLLAASAMEKLLHACWLHLHLWAAPAFTGCTCRGYGAACMLAASAVNKVLLACWLLLLWERCCMLAGCICICGLQLHSLVASAVKKMQADSTEKSICKACGLSRLTGCCLIGVGTDCTPSIKGGAELA
eukprot:scaffold153291_cov17-Tisochrysis_lutea.AAC.1